MNERLQASFLKDVLNLKQQRQQRARELAARKFIVQHGNPMRAAVAIDERIWQLALNFVQADRNQRNAETVHEMIHVLRCYFGGSVKGQPAAEITQKLEDLGLIQYPPKWLPPELKDPEKFYWCPLNCCVLERPEVLTEPTSENTLCLEQRQAIKDNMKKRADQAVAKRGIIRLPSGGTVRLKVPQKNFLAPAPTPIKFKAKTLRLLNDDEDDTNPNYVMCAALLGHADNAKTAEGYALYVSFICRQFPMCYDFVAPSRLAEAFAEPNVNTLDADNVDFNHDLHDLMPVPGHVSLKMLNNWYAYCIRQWPVLAERIRLHTQEEDDEPANDEDVDVDAQPAIVIPSAGGDTVSTFGALKLLDIFEYYDESERGMLYAIKVGKRKAITDIKLREGTNLLENSTGIYHPRRVLYKQAFAASTQVRLVVA